MSVSCWDDILEARISGRSREGDKYDIQERLRGRIPRYRVDRRGPARGPSAAGARTGFTHRIRRFPHLVYFRKSVT